MNTNDRISSFYRELGGPLYDRDKINGLDTVFQILRMQCDAHNFVWIEQQDEVAYIVTHSSVESCLKRSVDLSSFDFKGNGTILFLNQAEAPRDFKSILRDHKSLVLLLLKEPEFRGCLVLAWLQEQIFSDGVKTLLQGSLQQLREALITEIQSKKYERVKAKFEGLFNALPEGILFVEEGGGTAWVNPRAKTLLNVQPESASELQASVISEKMRWLREQTINREDLDKQAFNFFSKNGEQSFRNWKWVFKYRIYHVSSTLIKQAAFRGRLWVFEDVSYMYLKNTRLLIANQQITEISNQLLKQKERLEELNEEKNQVIQVVAHDLRAPMNRVLGLSHLLSLDAHGLSSDQQRYVQMINETVKQGVEMMQNLLDIESIESSRFSLSMVSTDIRTLMAHQVESLAPLARKKNITLHFESAESDLLVVTDRGFVTRILENLLSNAIKFSPENKKVYVELVKDEKIFQFTVRDEGQGISEEDQKKLFQKFSRLTARPTGGETSSGLGLSIVKKLVETLHGKISCESELEKGTAFRVEFPLLS